MPELLDRGRRDSTSSNSPANAGGTSLTSITCWSRLTSNWISPSCSRTWNSDTAPTAAGPPCIQRQWGGPCPSARFTTWPPSGDCVQPSPRISPADGVVSSPSTTPGLTIPPSPTSSTTSDGRASRRSWTAGIRSCCGWGCCRRSWTWIPAWARPMSTGTDSPEAT